MADATRERDDPGLAGRAALVSGGGAADDGIGNGRAAAILLARAGVRVMVADVVPAAAERTAQMIRAEGGTAEAVGGDVTDEALCRAMVAATIDVFGRIDFLDNNVGRPSRGSVVEADLEEWRGTMRLNVESMVMLSRFAIPAMIETAGGGAIVNVSSISALRPRGLTAYSTSKGAVIALTAAMAVDHGPQNIRVNCVVPGPMYTPAIYAHGLSDAARTARRQASVLNREGTGWDVGHAVRFLLSDHARYITGQSLIVDGGATLRGPERGTEDG